MPDSVFLLGDAHLKNLREHSIQAEDLAIYQQQFLDLAREYARLTGTPVDQMLRGVTTSEVYDLAANVLRSRHNALQRASRRGEWGRYYSEWLHLPWLTTYYDLGLLWLHAKYGWFECGAGSSRRAVVRACRVIPIDSACA